MEKYDNYKQQMGRLKKAMDNHFLLEALFIEYAIIEDRCESVLIHSGKKVRGRASLSQKLADMKKLINRPDSILGKYLTTDLIDEITQWSMARNDFIHHLMKQSFTHEDLQCLTIQGQAIIKTLCSKSTSYKRALEREQKKQEAGS